MRPETRDRVDAFWSGYFALPPGRLHEPGVTVTPSDDGWPGIVVAGDRRATHLRCPEELGRAVVEGLDHLTPSDLWQAETWTRLLGPVVAEVLGPSIHAYADDDTDLPAADARVREVPCADLQALAARVPPAEWSEGGFTSEVRRAFALVEKGRIMAAANLTDFDAMPADIGLVTDPRARGKGLGVAVAAAAVGAAIQEHRIARWRALETNLPSRAIARRLGFTDYGSNLTVRLSAVGLDS